MNYKEVILASFMILILLFAGSFMGSMIKQVMSGENERFNSIELSIIIAAIMLCVELAIITSNKKKKEEDIEVYVKQAREEVY